MKNSDGGPQARHTAGTPAGGRFAAQGRDEASVTLSATGPQSTPPDDDFDLDVALDSQDPESLWGSVRHGDARIRSAAAANPHLSFEQVAELLEPTQPTAVRVTAARRTKTGSRFAATDVNPFVRVWASSQVPAQPTAQDRVGSGIDVPLANMKRLMEGLLPVGKYANRVR